MAKICVITGGTSGIGKCTAEAMAQKGYTVYELSRREEGLPGMFHIPTDVTDPDACQRAIDEVVSQAGRIDVMINNAGFGISGAIEFTPVEQAKRQFDVNFFGMVNMNRAVIPVMRAQRSGRIVNLSSVAGAIPIPFQAFLIPSYPGLPHLGQYRIYSADSISAHKSRHFPLLYLETHGSRLHELPLYQLPAPPPH